MTRSIFTPNDIRDFEYVLRLEPLTVQDLHAIFYKAGMQKVRNVTYSNKQKTWLFHRIFEDYMLKDELRKYVMNYKQQKGEEIRDTNDLYENKTNRNMKKTIRLTESTLRKIVKESVKSVLNESKNGNFEKTYRTKSGKEIHVSIERPSGINDNERYGGWECWSDDMCDSFGDSYYVSGGLWIDPRTKEVIDYDGVFELPKAVKKALSELGFGISQL